MSDNTADSVINAVVKFAWPLFGITALATGTVLFWPSAVTLFKLNHLPSWMQDYIGLAFLVSTAVLACLILRTGYQVVANRIDESQYTKRIREVLLDLNGDEKAVLREFLLSGNDVQNLPFQDPAVLSLKNKRIIYLAASSALVRGVELEFPHQLPMGIKKMIEPEMVDLAEAYRLYDTDRERFQSSRPHFRQPRRGYY